MHKIFRQYQFLFNKKAQVLPYFLVMAMILILSWAMMINIAKLVREKMILQNNLDNAVLSIANLQARTLNMLGFTNYLIAIILSTSGYPDSFTASVLLDNLNEVGNLTGISKSSVSDYIKVLPPKLLAPSFSIEKVAGSMIPGPFSDYKHGKFGYVSSSGVENMKKTIDALQELQQLLLDNYMLNYGLIVNKFAKDTDSIMIVLPSRYAQNITSLNTSITDPEVLLGIKKNLKKIKYHKLQNYCFDIEATHIHWVNAIDYKQSNYSWYIQNEDFYDKKLVGFARKQVKSKEMYPLFANIFDIKMPTIYSLSAAGVYNTKGAMFPTKEDVITGVNLLDLASLITLGQENTMLIKLAIETGSIPLVGWILSAFFSALAVDLDAVSSVNFIKAKSDDDTPIKQYDNAKDGGWDAHLVPLKTE